MNNRKAAYAAIEGEIAYQDKMTGSASRPDMVENLSAGDHLLAMEHCLAEARRAWYSGALPHEAAAEHVRKVTALGVRFMERFSAPPRNPPLVTAEFIWVKAAGLTVDGLTLQEAEELDTLIFRKNCDYPFGVKEQDRIDELRKKSEASS